MEETTENSAENPTEEKSFTLTPELVQSGTIDPMIGMDHVEP